MRLLDRPGQVGERIAQYQNARGLGFPRQDASDDGNRWDHAGRRLMMLVQHDLNAQILGHEPHIEELVVVVGASFGIEMFVGQIDPN